MIWIPIQDMPEHYIETFDVWQAYRDSVTGEIKGRRIANCWNSNGHVLNGNHCDKILGVTHYMKMPKGPNLYK